MIIYWCIEHVVKFVRGKSVFWTILSPQIEQNKIVLFSIRYIVGYCRKIVDILITHGSDFKLRNNSKQSFVSPPKITPEPYAGIRDITENFVNGKFDQLSHLKRGKFDVLSCFLRDILDILSFCLLSYSMFWRFPVMSHSLFRRFDVLTFRCFVFRCFVRHPKFWYGFEWKMKLGLIQLNNWKRATGDGQWTIKQRITTLDNGTTVDRSWSGRYYKNKNKIHRAFQSLYLTIIITILKDKINASITPNQLSITCNASLVCNMMLLFHRGSIYPSNYSKLNLYVDYAWLLLCAWLS